MERIIKNIGQSYMQSEVNRVYYQGRIKAIIIAGQGFYVGDGHEAILKGQRDGLTLLCDDDFYYNISRSVKFEGDDTQCKIYINGQLFATADKDKKLISCDNEILCQSEKLDTVGLAMVAVFLLTEKISQMSQVTNNDDVSFVGSVLLSDYAIAEQKKRAMEYEQKKEAEHAEAYRKRVEREYQEEQLRLEKIKKRNKIICMAVVMVVIALMLIITSAVKHC
jgi:hypothetical protein